MTTTRLLAPLLLALAAPLLTTQALAGPTVSADLDLGTSTRSAGSIDAALPNPSPLYLAGFVLRAGWRFDVAPVWFLPEVGAGYAVERFAGTPTQIAPGNYVSAPADVGLARLFGGGRIGWSGVLRPELDLEPSIDGHAGAGWYGAGYSRSPGYACDVGLSLDSRVRRHVILGVQVGYDVVSVQPPQSAGVPAVFSLPAVADPWVSYGIHAGWLFW